MWVWAQFEVLLRNTSHYIYASLQGSLCIAGLEAPRIYRTLLAFGPKGPDTLYCNGNFITNFNPPQGGIESLCETRGLEGPFYHKSIFAVKLSGLRPVTLKNIVSVQRSEAERSLTCSFASYA